MLKMLCTKSVILGGVFSAVLCVYLLSLRLPIIFYAEPAKIHRGPQRKRINYATFRANLC